MLDIIKIIAPIFGIIFVGFAALSLKLISKEQLQAIGAYVIKIALPCLLIVNISAQQINKIWQPQYLVSYAMASIVVFSLVLLLYRYRFRQPLDQSALMAMGGSMSNTGFIGSAILHLIIGTSSTIYFAMTLIVENFVVFLVFLICLELARQKNEDFTQIILKTCLGIVKNPMIIALAIGMTLSVLQINLPIFFRQILEPIGKTASTMGLFVVGGSLYGISIHRLKTIWGDAGIIFISKMVFMPLLVYLLFLCMPNTTPEMVFSGVLLASISMATLFTIFGQSFGIGEKTSAILLICTLANLLMVMVVIKLLLPH